MFTEQNLQITFLNKLYKEQIPVSIFLINGVKLHGTIDGIDENIIMLKGAITQMIYKHAIYTVGPTKNE